MSQQSTSTETGSKREFPKALKNTVGHQTSYDCNEIEIPDSFLTGPSPLPVTLTHVPFADSELPEYKDKVAFVVKNVFSPEECQQFLKLAELAAPWDKALVNVGGGKEAYDPGYRDSKRIIWDTPTVADRVFKRIIGVPGVKEILSDSEQWELEKLNERMRVLKYVPGQFFKGHVDGVYAYTSNGDTFASRYTLHLYLNGSAASSPTEEAELVGGATAFLSKDETRHMDVNPETGSVLIFQHEGLWHEGATVLKGVKYTVRTDFMYRQVKESGALE
ncbi:oxidoreductase domain containing protein [Metarhizium rileyi]|uniref:Oxidoreductase domain containing protein n=1 Tax=Metarhizium rileyi (strain RCEF 4871) TaxID=1649241 RepID=A0A167AW81_METRR|nr:oxidoreductase domain containing protein [Metarhizium rileyi RCEF 4871]TWU71842.1 hypothetical protein ED733_002658 [Metarhizium rileyi]